MTKKEQILWDALVRVTRIIKENACQTPTEFIERDIKIYLLADEALKYYQLKENNDKRTIES